MTARVASLLGILAAVVLVAGAVRYGATLALAVSLASPATDATLSRWLGAPEVESVRVTGGVRVIDADLYRPPGQPGHPRPGVVLVHGLSAAGRRQPDLARLARGLARHGQLVLVPEFEGLAAFRLTGREVDDVAAAIADLRRRTPSVAVAGFSFGAGPALLAAADAPGLRWVGSFGGYADLTNVIRFIATGTHAFRDRRYEHAVEEYNRWKLAALLVPFLGDSADRRALEMVVAAKLANPAADTTALERDAGAGARVLLALVRSRRADEVDRLLASLPPPARAALAALSPMAAAGRIRAPLLLAHGAADPSIPFTESLRLADAAGPRARVVILHSFHHTGPEGRRPSLGEQIRDAWNLLMLVDTVLGRGFDGAGGHW